MRVVPTGVPRSPAVARNIGIREAKGDILCLTDADCIAEPDWLARLTAPVDAGAMHVVGGGVDFEASNYWTLCDNLSWFHEYLAGGGEGKRELLPTLNLCVKRCVIEVVGLFNESYPRAAGEDAEWTTRMRRAGFSLHFLPQAVVHHHPARASFEDIWHHAYTYGRYSVKVNPEFSDYLDTSFVFRKWWAILLLAPAVSLVATLRIYLRNPSLWRHWYAVPGILISKVAWILGASRTLRCTDRAV